MWLQYLVRDLVLSNIWSGSGGGRATVPGGLPGDLAQVAQGGRKWFGLRLESHSRAPRRCELSGLRPLALLREDSQRCRNSRARWRSGGRSRTHPAPPGQGVAVMRTHTLPAGRQSPQRGIIAPLQHLLHQGHRPKRQPPTGKGQEGGSHWDCADFLGSAS